MSLAIGIALPTNRLRLNGKDLEHMDAEFEEEPKPDKAHIPTNLVGGTSTAAWRRVRLSGDGSPAVAGHGGDRLRATTDRPAPDGRDEFSVGFKTWVLDGACNLVRCVPRP